MDSNNNARSFLKLIEDYDPIFLEIRMILQPYCGENNFHIVNLFKLLMMTYHGW
ncbi:hypothetical protein HanHA300_Chr17g0668421 [Helianthus annuus]|nr:hypothetical protein HanHA300_Chr17g0668421 [Helianthus annuus]KAJ0435221.1 hypothetical protein HanIR_Chr17g0890961 [Helianthus annuus]